MMMRSSAVLLAVGLVVLSAVRAEDLDVSGRGRSGPGGVGWGVRG